MGGLAPAMTNLPFLLLAVLGMLPATLLPVMTSAVRHGLGFGVVQAGWLSGSIILSTGVGSLLMARIGVPSSWKGRAIVGLLLLLGIEVASAFARDFRGLLGLQMVAGLIGGMLTGIGYAAIGRAAAAVRLFGTLVSLQFLIGGVGLFTLPTLIAATGAWLLFAVFAASTALVLLLLMRVPPAFLPPREASPGRTGLPRGRVRWGFAALFLSQAGHSAGAAFILDFGRTLGLAPDTVQGAAGLGGALGLVGALAAALIGTRFGRRGPVVLASAAGAVAAVLLFQPVPLAWLVGCALGSIAWAYSVPYVLDACVAVEPSRDDAMWLSFFAKIGIAAGPFAATLVVAENDFGPAIILATVLGLASLLLFLHLEARPAPDTP